MDNPYYDKDGMIIKRPFSYGLPIEKEPEGFIHHGNKDEDEWWLNNFMSHKKSTLSETEDKKGYTKESVNNLIYRMLQDMMNETCLHRAEVQAAYWSGQHGEKDFYDKDYLKFPEK